MFADETLRPVTFRSKLGFYLVNKIVDMSTLPSCRKGTVALRFDEVPPSRTPCPMLCTSPDRESHWGFGSGAGEAVKCVHPLK